MKSDARDAAEELQEGDRIQMIEQQSRHGAEGAFDVRGEFDLLGVVELLPADLVGSRKLIEHLLEQHGIEEVVQHDVRVGFRRLVSLV